MKANMSAFDQGDKSLQKYQVQLDGLNKKLSVQEARVESARKTYDKMVAAHGEGSKEAEKAAIALNKESASFNNLERYIGKVTEEMNKSNSSLVKYGTQLTNISEKAGQVGSVLTTTVTPAMLALGAAAIIGANNAEDAFIKIQNNMGSTVEETEKLKNIANNVFKDGWGDSLDSVVTSLLEVKEQLGNIPDEELESITKQAIALEQSLGMDTTESLRGVNALMTTYGLTAQQAFDYIVKGAQNGLNKTDELGDNLAEYVPLWEQNGYSIEEMFSTLQAGLNAGAYNLDKVNDLVKEFGVRVGDGTIKKAVEEMGGSWNKIYKGWEKAGGTNAELFELLANNLASIEDPQAKQLALTEIWGSMGEDAGLKVVEALGKVENGYEDVSGAAQKVTENMELSRAQQFQALLRGMADTLVPLGDILLDIGEDALPILQDAVESINDAWENLSDEQQEMVVQFGLTAAAAGPVIKVLSGITGGAGNLISKLPGLSKGTNDTSKALETMTTMAAGGTKGASVLTTGISALTSGLNPATLAVGGLIAALGAGALIWSAWGEDAYKSSERTRQWGVDVGETVDGHLDDMQRLTQSTSGQFNNLANGLTTNKEQMSRDFVELGQTIESSLNERISQLDELMANLPETVRSTLTALLSEDKKRAEESLKIVEDNNQRIQEINDRAAKENRSTTIAENKIMLDLNRESAEAYVNTLKISQKERDNILTAMNGDVEKSTKEQASAWAKSLAEQRQEMKTHYNEQKETYLESLKELGYSDTAIEEQAKIWDKANEATTQGIDQQLATIAQKYPEIAKEISFTNGQTIDSMGELGEQQIQENEKIIQRAGALSNELAKNAEENARKLSWVSDETKLGAETWNNIVLDPKTGEVKTNVREEILKAGEDSVKWNEMRFQLHNADLDSNAKSIIGESAILNGWWDGMSWDEKAIILNDEFSQNIYKSLEESGKWNEMSLEEKTAIMYSNTPEKMTETLAYLGLWDEFQPDIKEVNADNTGFIQSIRDSEEKMNYWRSIPDETKEMLGQNYDLLTTIFQSEEAYKNFKSLSDEEKRFLGENTDLMAAVFQSQESYNNWVSMPDEQKNLLANNKDLMAKVFSSKESYEEWMRLPATEKRIRASTNVPGVASESKGALATIPNLKATQILARTNAWEIARSAQRAIDSVKGKTVNILTNYETRGNPAGAGVKFHAEGTNYHPGGPAVLGDGGEYEPFLTPKGDFGISPNIDTLFHLPRGTKVWPSIEAWESKIPHFANGSANTPTDAMKLLALAGNRVSEREVRDTVSVKRSETVLESSSQAQKIEGDTYNITIHAADEISKSTIDKWAKDITKAIKREESKRKNARGRTVNLYG